MKKLFKTSILSLLILTSFSFIICFAEDSPDTIQIHRDSNSTTAMPKYFRKSCDISTLNNSNSLNIKGLDNLNISGSSQFTEFNLPLLLKAIDTNRSIINLDLREESHGFINGIAISFHAKGKNLNEGLNTKEILSAEYTLLKNIEINIPFSFSNINEKITPKTINDENVLCEKNKVTYLRFPVRDGEVPNAEITKKFVDFVNNQPKDTWIHFHCKDGIGRTTLFMIMYDIMKNCSEVSLNDIIARQVLLSKISENLAVDFYIGKKFDFLNDFYNKCKNNEL